MSPPPLYHRSLLAPAVALAVVMAPLPSLAAFGGDEVSQPPSEASADAGDHAPASAPAQGDSPANSPANGGGPANETADAPDELQPTVTELEPAEGPTGGGVAGAVVDPDDPNATRAQSDLEGESLDTNVDGVPERLPKLQAAGWWTTFTAVALATTGGIFAGVAETRQDEAERLAYAFDLNTGSTTLYGPVADDYERLLSEGDSYQWVARGFIIAGGVALIVGITLFAVDGARRRRAGRSGSARLRLDPGPGGLHLRF